MKANQKILDERCNFFIFFPYKNVRKKLFSSVSASDLKTTKSLLLVNYLSPESVTSNQARPRQSRLYHRSVTTRTKKLKTKFLHPGMIYKISKS